MSTARDDLMDYIDETYNNYEHHEYLGKTYERLFGEIDDSGPEGMFTGLSTQDLQMLADALDNGPGGIVEPAPAEHTFTFTDDEISVLLVAMDNFSDVTWTKDREMSHIAKKIQRKIRGY